MSGSFFKILSFFKHCLSPLISVIKYVLKLILNKLQLCFIKKLKVITIVDTKSQRGAFLIIIRAYQNNDFWPIFFYTTDKVDDKISPKIKLGNPYMVHSGTISWGRKITTQL